ncbi:beta,beta-carotene 15,15'-dioxygenase isoform X2 [Hyalella azteca]|nr:beta,beta-carotene 15,15'-dioxygenase isoform X2 [Hyalella azteca]
MSAADSPASVWVRHCEQDTRDGVEGSVSGTIPRWLNGNLIRNGPGGKKVGEHHYNHLFDGLSLLHLVNITDGKAKYISRYLESETYKLNHRANRIVVSEFGTAGVPDPCLSLFDKFSTYFKPALTQKRTDNCLVNVMQVKDELVAMTELSTVRVVDPNTLETKPELVRYTDYVSVQRVTAHPHLEGNVAYNLAFSTGPSGPPKFAIISLADGKIQNSKIVASVPCRWKFTPPYLHSFGITDNFYIIAETPMAIDARLLALPAFFGMSSFNALRYFNGEKTKFRIMSRETGEEIKVNAYAPGFFNFHYLNCYEKDDMLVIDVCAADDNLIEYLKMENIKKPADDMSRKMCNVEPRRYIIPVGNLDSSPVNVDLLKDFPDAKIGENRATAVKEANGELMVTGVRLGEVFMELPRINYRYNKKQYTYAYGASVSDYKLKMFDFDGIVKLNVTNGETTFWQDQDYFSSEPVFVETPGGVEEDDGVLLSILISKNKPKELALIVLNAQDMKEMARVDFIASGAVTSTFHGQFIASKGEVHAY